MFLNQDFLRSNFVNCIGTVNSYKEFIFISYKIVKKTQSNKMLKNKMSDLPTFGEWGGDAYIMKRFNRPVHLIRQAGILFVLVTGSH